jgi:hypothetical protein
VVLERGDRGDGGSDVSNPYVYRVRCGGSLTVHLARWVDGPPQRMATACGVAVGTAGPRVRMAVTCGACEEIAGRD